MMPRLNAREHALVSLLIGCVILWLVYFVLARPLIGIQRSIGERIESQEHRLAQYRRIAGQRVQVEQEVHALEAASTGMGDYFQDDSTALAAAELQQRLESIASPSGAHIVSTQPVADTAKEPFDRVIVRVHVRGPLAAIAELTRALESGTPRVFLDAVVIQSMNRPAEDRPAPGRKNPGGEPTARRYVDEIDVRFDVIGYLGRDRA